MKLVFKGLMSLVLTKFSLVKGSCVNKTLAVGHLCRVPEIPSPSDLYDGEFVNLTSVDFTNDLPDPLTPGVHTYELNYTFADGSEGNCDGTVTVIDDEPLNSTYLDCGTDGIMFPCESETFTATYEKANGCAVDNVLVTASACQFCNGAGKTIDKSDDCEVEYDENTFTVNSTSGVKTFISYDVEVISGNESITSTCTICVGTPNNGECAENRFLRRMQGKSQTNPNKGKKLKKEKKNKKGKKDKKKKKKKKNKGPFQCPADWDPLEDEFMCVKKEKKGKKNKQKRQ